MKKFSVLFGVFGLISIGSAFACEMVFVPVNTSCGKLAVASGCTTEEILEDAMQWEEFYCGESIAP
ncbi:hypothetical protein [Algoriphagus sp. CAU 1675]|uniref:hypothetical protein n=1 Tax=Algoriphagus sp. CAU 1675 TaxID=3032597 RepID=UPI0023D9B1DD|nr:hypothetical protein [Algoriphagus sp. CAU 1675]MDF2157524.1 hypothetical protein [Algoriphagus sp. CAU 1675]